MSDYEGYPGRAPIPKQTVKEAECVEGTVRKSAKQQGGSNWNHLVTDMDERGTVEEGGKEKKEDIPSVA